MKFNTYIIFNGNCREAFKWYVEIFNGKMVSCETYRDTPADLGVQEENMDQIIHAMIKVGNGFLMGADDPMRQYSPPCGMHISVNFDDAGEAGRIFGLLSDGANVSMPFQKTFWADGFGMLTDRYNVPWMINCNSAEHR